MQEKSYHELLQKSGGVKVNRCKVFVFGMAETGKSTLKESLQRVSKNVTCSPKPSNFVSVHKGIKYVKDNLEADLSGGKTGCKGLTVFKCPRILFSP